MVQTDGNVLMGGQFTTISANGGGSVVRNRIARLAFAPSLVPTQAVSRKLHGGTPFDTVMPIVGMAGIECRMPGVGDSHQLIVTFNSPVSVASVSVMSSNGQAAGSASVSQSVVTVNLTGVANAQTIGVTLVQVSNGSGTANVFVPVSILLGDSSGDGIVNAGDATQTRNRSGQNTNGSNFRSDFNGDGVVNSADSITVRNRSGNSLP